MATQTAASAAPCDAPDSEDEAVEDLFGFDFNGIVVCDDSEEESDGDCAPHVPKRRVGAEIPRVDAASLAPGEFLERFSRRNAPVVLSNCEGVPTHLTVEWWREHHGDREVPLDVNTGGAVKAPLRDFLAGKLRTRYLRNLHLGDWFPGAADDVGLPPVMGENLLADEEKVRGCPRTWRTWLELFICFEDCAGFPFLHRDICHTHASVSPASSKLGKPFKTQRIAGTRCRSRAPRSSRSSRPTTRATSTSTRRRASRATGARSTSATRTSPRSSPSSSSRRGRR